MGENGMMGRGTGGRGTKAMMGALAVQTLGMLGLAGIFVHLVVDPLGGRRES